MNGFDLRDSLTIERGGSTITALYLGSDLIWPKTNFEEDYLTIIALTANTVVKFYGPGISIQASTDKTNWTTYTSTPLAYDGTTIATLNKHQKLYLKGTNSAYAYKQGDEIIYNSIIIDSGHGNGPIIQGNIMSMIYGDNFIGQTVLTDPYAFYGFFGGGAPEWSSPAESIYPIKSIKNLVLPATTLTPYCYACMFQYKNQMIDSPAILPSTTLAEGCYYKMFYHCDDLENAPQLPATSLSEKCYYAMFNNCNLTTSPVLPAPSVPTEAYKMMLSNNTSLNQITMLGTQLGAYALDNWVVNVAPTGTFIKAVQQNSLPIGDSGIPTGWVQANGYAIYINYSANGTVTANMQSSLPGMEVELTITPNAGYELSSLTVIDSYQHIITVTDNKFTMPNSPVTISAAFSAIPYTITILPTTNGTCTASTYSATVGESVTLTVNPDTSYSLDDLYAMTATSEVDIINKRFIMPPNDVTVTCTFANFNEEYLTIESMADNNTIYFLTQDTQNSTFSIQYSTDKINWSTVTCSGYIVPSVIATIDKYEKLYLSNMTISDVYETISCTENAKLKGNIMSLINRSTFTSLTDLSTYNTDNIFAYLFAEIGYHIHWDPPHFDSKYIEAKDLILPATILSDYCYDHMFASATLMTSPPLLPAATLAEGCYQHMFGLCSLMDGTFTLPATTLEDNCYKEMFYYCTSLTTAPALPATILTDHCYYYMFYSTAITSAPVLPATIMTPYCYCYMFHDTNITSVPALPATTLAEGCYAGMFSSCTSLTTVPSNLLPVTTLADYCYSSMFGGCSSLTNAPELPATVLTQYCYNSMFGYCSSLTTAPVLPAHAFAPYCYQWMFRYCTSLSYIKCLIDTPNGSYISSDNNSYTDQWVEGVYSNGTFIHHPNVNWAQSSGGIYMDGYPVNFNIVEGYEIDTYAPANQGSITANPTCALGGETVHLTFYPSTGYRKNPSYEVLKKDGSYDSVSHDVNDNFIMPNCAVMIDLPFIVARYNVAIDSSIQHGTVTSSVQQTTYNQTVALTVTPNSGYQLDSITVTDANSNPVTVTYNSTDDTYDFNMPNSSVFVTAVFSQISYNVTIASGITDGSISSNKSTAHYGEIVSLTDTPSLGYELFQITVTGATSSTSITVTYDSTDEKYKFVMPAEAVSVTALFRMEYITIESLDANNEIKFNISDNSSPIYDIYVSTDKEYFERYTPTTAGTTIATLNAGDKIYIGGQLQGNVDTTHYHFFSSTGRFKVRGNIKTLLDNDYLSNPQLCRGLFYGCTKLTNASGLVLSLTTLTPNCYESMFKGCTYLTVPPVISAVSLDVSCCRSMFQNCTRLQSAPELNATALALDCYREMFKSCSALQIPPELPATIVGEGCYRAMFDGCSHLIKTPILRASTLAQYCYYYMFQNCTRLAYIYCLANNISAYNCTSNWVKGVTTGDNTRIFYKSSAMNSWGAGQNGIPAGWTVQNYTS